MFVFSSECGERNLIGTFEVTVEDGAVVTYQPMDERASAFPGSIDDLPTMAAARAGAPRKPASTLRQF